VLHDVVVTAMAAVCLMPAAGVSQSKSIVVGEEVRGTMYMPAYVRNIGAVSEKSLREEPRMISKFVEALSEGILFYRNNANKEENIRILAKYLRVPLDKNRAMVEEGYETYRDMLLKKPYADPSALNPIPRQKM
jgi:ABC-type nitrate/sulfonate/bicarbonate transport system substrate-binding protein